jgi:hypothetical protein
MRQAKAAAALVWAAGLVAVIPLARSAADVRTTPRLELGGLYSSNLWLQPNDLPEADAVTGGLLDASLEMSTTTPLSRTVVTPRVHVTKFGSADSNKESTDLYLTLDTSRHGQRGNYGANIDLAREGVSSNELVSPGSSDPLGSNSGGESGVIFGKNTLKSAAGRAYAAWRVSTRSQLNLSGGFARSVYDRTFTNAQDDYWNVDGALGWTFQATERVRVIPSVYWAEFRPENDISGAKSAGARLEVWREQSEKSRTFIRLGAARSRIDSAISTSGRVNRTNADLGIGFERRFERGRLNLQATRALDPNGSGYLLVRHDAFIQYTHQFTQRVEGVFAARAVWASAADNASGYADRTYLTGSASLEWRVKRDWSVHLRYGNARQEFDDARTTATASSVALKAVYQLRRDQ